MSRRLGHALSTTTTTTTLTRRSVCPHAGDGRVLRRGGQDSAAREKTKMRGPERGGSFLSHARIGGGHAAHKRPRMVPPGAVRGGRRRRLVTARKRKRCEGRPAFNFDTLSSLFFGVFAPPFLFSRPPFTPCIRTAEAPRWPRCVVCVCAFAACVWGGRPPDANLGLRSLLPQSARAFPHPLPRSCAEVR